MKQEANPKMLFQIIKLFLLLSFNEEYQAELLLQNLNFLSSLKFYDGLKLFNPKSNLKISKKVFTIIRL